MRIPREAWILVCDGRKALLLLNHGDAELPDLRIEEAVDNGPNLKTSEQGSDRPGRLADASGGSHRSAVEQTDWHHRQETAFAARLAEMLEVRHSEKQTSAIILVAPPRMLGDLRKVLSPRIRAATVNEVDKDLVNLPTDELERALTGA